MLEANGTPIEKLSRDLIPIPGSLRHHISSHEVAMAVAYESEKVLGPLGVAAGFVLKSEYDKWPDSGGSLLLRRVAKDQFRVLGETEPVPDVPDGPVLVSAKTDPELVARVEKFLLEELPRQERVCSAIGLIRYEASGRQPTAEHTAPDTHQASYEEAPHDE
jgi:ABC-type phosphate/phosphonate transport system substrate-binding protein